MSDIRSVWGSERALTDAQRHQAAEVIAWAFDAKVRFAGITHQQMVDIMGRCLAYERCLFALSRDMVVGVLGATTTEGHLLRLTYRALRDNMSWLKAALGMLFLSIERQLVEGELRIEPLAVSPDWRGQGVGTLLLERVIADAPAMGCRLLALDVVDTNVGARRLYERTGFRLVRTQRSGLFTRRAGFTATHYMQLPLADARATRGGQGNAQ